MPIVPYDPYGDDEREDDDAPDIGDLVDRIIDGGDGPTPVGRPA